MCTVSTCLVYGGGLMPGRRAGPGNGKYNAETGQQKVQLLSKTKHFAYLGMLLRDP